MFVREGNSPSAEENLSLLMVKRFRLQLSCFILKTMEFKRERKKHEKQLLTQNFDVTLLLPREYDDRNTIPSAGWS